MYANLERAFAYLKIDEGEEIRVSEMEPHLRRRFGVPEWMAQVPLEKLTRERAKEILENEVWNRLGCNTLPSGLDYFLFDTGVVAGAFNAERWLKFQSACNLGPLTIVQGLREVRARSLRFRKDWNSAGSANVNRVNRAYSRALKMIAAELK